MPHSYRRHLPHQQPDAAIVFVTFRTARSLPKAVIAGISEMKSTLDRQLKMGKLLPKEYVLERKRLFTAYDNALDSAATDPNDPACLLHKPAFAKILIQRLYRGQSIRRFILHRYWVMPNHVHLLVEPLPRNCTDLPLLPVFPSVTQNVLSLKHLAPENIDYEFWPIHSIMKSLKGAAAYDINKLSGRNGPLFQQESFDHYVRERDEYLRIIDYIDQNLIKAGLCSHAFDWPWSTVGEQCGCG